MSEWVIAHFLSESRIRSLIWQKTRDSLRNSMSEFPTLVPFHPPHRFSFFTQVFDHFLHITVTSILNHPLYLLVNYSYIILVCVSWLIGASEENRVQPLSRLPSIAMQNAKSRNRIEQNVMLFVFFFTYFYKYSTSYYVLYHIAIDISIRLTNHSVILPVQKLRLPILILLFYRITQWPPCFVRYV